jgi:hypothetical protein
MESDMVSGASICDRSESESSSTAPGCTQSGPGDTTCCSSIEVPLLSKTWEKTWNPDPAKAFHVTYSIKTDNFVCQFTKK